MYHLHVAKSPDFPYRPTAYTMHRFHVRINTTCMHSLNSTPIHTSIIDEKRFNVVFFINKLIVKRYLFFECFPYFLVGQNF